MKIYHRKHKNTQKKSSTHPMLRSEINKNIFNDLCGWIVHRWTDPSSQRRSEKFAQNYCKFQAEFLFGADGGHASAPWLPLFFCSFVCFSACYRWLVSLPQICRRTTKPMKSRLRTSTVVGPIFRPGASSVYNLKMPALFPWLPGAARRCILPDISSRSVKTIQAKWMPYSSHQQKKHVLNHGRVCLCIPQYA